MIVYFGGILREELVRLTEKPESRSRARSSGSHISFDSSDGQDPVIKLGKV